MAKYKIYDYSYRKAKSLGVNIFPSEKKGKKIDVYSLSGELLASVGAVGYKDYPTYMELERMGEVPAGTANQKKQAYRKRHKKNLSVHGSPGYYAAELLW